jgi:cell wall-associated NlpC family hydrolase
MIRLASFLLAFTFLIGFTGCHSIRNALRSSDELPVTEKENPVFQKKKNKELSPQAVPKDEKGNLAEKKHPDNLYRKEKPKPATVASASATIERIIQEAESYLGTPYAWGGMSRKGVDCSGLIVLAFQSANQKIARVSGDQAKGGKAVARSELRRGDLLFFSSKQAGVIGHTALVVAVKDGSVKFIHAANSGVRYDYLESAHWSKLYICARRYGD